MSSTEEALKNQTLTTLTLTNAQSSAVGGGLRVWGGGGRTKTNFRNRVQT